MISRRHALVPIATAFIAPALNVEAHNPSAKLAPSPPLPDRYDEPLGIGLEGWPYPAPLHWQQCMAGDQSIRMAYMDIPPTARSNKRTVVLLHGKNFDSSYWAGPIKDLTEAGFRVIVPDQIGFNKSSKPNIPYSLDMLAEFTANLLGALQIDQAVLVGHSTGGMLAVRMAATYPQRVERLILEDPIGLIDYRRYIPPQSTETLIAAEKRRTVSSYRAFVRSYFPILSAHAMEPFVEWRMRVTHSGEFDRFCRATALTYQMIYRESVLNQYDDISAATLMIIGEKDRTTPLMNYATPDKAAQIPSIPQAAPAVIKSMRKGSLVVVPDVGHVPHLEAPDAFREHILTFLTT